MNTLQGYQGIWRRATRVIRLTDAVVGMYRREKRGSDSMLLILLVGDVHCRPGISKFLGEAKVNHVDHRG